MHMYLGCHSLLFFGREAVGEMYVFCAANLLDKCRELWVQLLQGSRNVHSLKRKLFSCNNIGVIVQTIAGRMLPW